MAATSVFGTVADELGMVHWVEYERISPTSGRKIDIYATDPTDSYAAAHPAPIPVKWGHGDVIGQVKSLVKSSGKLHALAEVDLAMDELEALADGGSLRWSSGSIQRRPDDPWTITELSLTTRPASVGLPEVRRWPCRIHDVKAWAATSSTVLHRAVDLAREYRYSSAKEMVVVDLDPPPPPENRAVEVRHAATIDVADVTFSQRTIELVAAPYNRPTSRVFHRGQRITEEFAPAAFAGTDVARVRVNRDHDPARTVGQVVDLDHARSDGLVATVKVSRTPLGDETLTLAADGCLDASVGFLINAGGEHWPGRSRRRVTSAELDHIALVPSPAYDGAAVLAVRHH
jgi:HK97 family phage prohead protease